MGTSLSKKKRKKRVVSNESVIMPTSLLNSPLERVRPLLFQWWQSSSMNHRWPGLLLESQHLTDCSIMCSVQCLYFFFIVILHTYHKVSSPRILVLSLLYKGKGKEALCLVSCSFVFPSWRPFLIWCDQTGSSRPEKKTALPCSLSGHTCN